MLNYQSDCVFQHNYTPYINHLICYYLIILKIDRVERLNWDTKVNMV